jgi:hypothetical protein
MYRFVECTVEKYMTRAVRTFTRRTTMRELEALFEKYDFNSFPVVEEGKMFGIVTKFYFLRAFAFASACEHFAHGIQHRDPSPIVSAVGLNRTDKPGPATTKVAVLHVIGTRCSIDLPSREKAGCSIRQNYRIRLGTYADGTGPFSVAGRRPWKLLASAKTSLAVPAAAVNRFEGFAGFC